jgi:transcription initiation factor IIE alpha subunit
MFYEKFISYNVHIETLTGYLLIGIIRSNYINFHEIICSYESKNIKNLKLLVQTAVSNICYLCFMKN